MKHNSWNYRGCWHQTCPLIAALADTYTTTIQIAEITQHLPLSYRQVDRAEISMTHQIFRFDLYHYSPKAKYLLDIVGFFCMRRKLKPKSKSQVTDHFGTFAQNH
ncbi:hypothetical protein BLNAU_25155 [Blattamonas nauphoetae]|uniref:Transposase n=1 Tax=Blattamonas nauphoetae TaxID=2049346 RepID=A0ABQ9WKE3_9EUKA|nr:hypothetical protein BLNAU_25155 [Blattamonas nauphoetae]